MKGFGGIPALAVLAVAASACTQTTAIQQVLDPTLAPATAAEAGDAPADMRNAEAIAVEKDGERIFLVPGAGASPDRPN